MNKLASLSVQMDNITSEMNANLNTSSDLDATGTALMQVHQSSSGEIAKFMRPEDILNLSTMVDDFEFVRHTLRENADNGRRVLTNVTLELLECKLEPEQQLDLVKSFAELNKAVHDNMKLYIQAYREISNVLLNINKINPTAPQKDKMPDDPTASPISTIDILKRLNKKENTPCT